MIKKTGIAAISLLLALASYAGPQEKETDKVETVTIAEILKIDAKKKTLDVRNVAQSSSAGRGASRSPGGPSGNGRPGGGRRQGGIGFPGGGRNGGGQPSVVPNQPKEYKVFVTNDTVLKLFNTTIEFSDLHVSDRIAVSGVPKGKNGDLEATTITRDPPQ